jgi:hypothetical protein
VAEESPGCPCGGTGACGCLAKSRKEILSGGLADKKRPESFDKDALREGTQVEFEHTDSEGMAREIAMDHLTEDPEYYKKLKQIEKALEGLPDLTFKKGRKLARRMKFHDLDISIETDKGQNRYWYDPHGKGEKGVTKMKYPYGYIRRTEGADDEHVDVYVGPTEGSRRVFVIRQMKKPDFTKYDEDKVMLGFESPKEAKQAYLIHYNSPRFFGSMKEMDIDSFKEKFVSKAFDFGELNTLTRSYVSADDDLQKGIADRIKRFWTRIKDRFKRAPKDQPKPQKRWVVHSELGAPCRTGICLQLDGITIPIDAQFDGINGYQLDGPPAHRDCHCTLEFVADAKKSMDSITMDEQNMPSMTPQQPMGPPPIDVETLEGVEHLLSRMGGVNDDELMKIASEIWGPGFQFENSSPQQAREEVVGFLHDQRDLLFHAPPVTSPVSMPREPQGSTNYSPVSHGLNSGRVTRSIEGNSFDVESHLKSLTGSLRKNVSSPVGSTASAAIASSRSRPKWTKGS